VEGGIRVPGTNGFRQLTTKEGNCVIIRAPKIRIRLKGGSHTFLFKAKGGKFTLKDMMIDMLVPVQKAMEREMLRKKSYYNYKFHWKYHGIQYNENAKVWVVDFRRKKGLPHAEFLANS